MYYNILIPNASIFLNKNDNNNYIFLRNWQNKQLKSSTLVVVADHPWKNFEKLHSDTVILDDLYNRIISTLTIRLNNIHELNYSEKSWKAIIGPWLYNFISVIFERWINMNFVMENYKIHKILVTTLIPQNQIANDYNSFTRLALSHKWNEEIYIQIAKYFYSCDIEESDNLYYQNEINIERKINQSTSIINFFKIIYIKLIKIFLQNKGIMFFGANITNRNIIKFSYENKSIPIIPFAKEFNYKNEYKSNLRDENFKFDYKNNFEKYLCLILFKHIPFNFLENFHNQKNISLKYFGSNLNLKYIITSSGYYHDLFSFYLADSINKSIKIVGLQHGGGYGSALKSFNENFEIQITDIFLSWGWQKKFSNVMPFYYIKKSININNIPKDKCTIFLNANDMYSLRVSTESYIHNINPTKDYNSIIKMTQIITNYIGNNILFRGYPLDYGWNDRDYLQDNLGYINWDATSSINEIFNKSKLLIFNLNSTGYLEALISNFPTILILTEERKIRIEAVSFFELLKKNKILFDNFEDATQHILNIWNKIDEWWLSEDLQKDLLIFTHNFVRRTNDIPTELNKALTSYH